MFGYFNKSLHTLPIFNYKEMMGQSRVLLCTVTLSFLNVKINNKSVLYVSWLPLKQVTKFFTLVSSRKSCK